MYAGRLVLTATLFLFVPLVAAIAGSAVAGPAHQSRLLGAVLGLVVGMILGALLSRLLRPPATPAPPSTPAAVKHE